MTRSDARKKLAELQAEADNGFHRELRAWVDDNSSVARVLAAARPADEDTLRTAIEAFIENGENTWYDQDARVMVVEVDDLRAVLAAHPAKDPS